MNAIDSQTVRLGTGLLSTAMAIMIVAAPVNAGTSTAAPAVVEGAVDPTLLLLGLLAFIVAGVRRGGGRRD